MQAPFKVLACALMTAVVAAPAAAQESTATLLTTLNFIRDKVAAQGQVNYSAKLHDSADNSSWSNTFGASITNVTPQPRSCKLSYHWRSIQNGKVESETDIALPLDQIVSVELSTRRREIDDQAAQTGHPTWTSEVTPIVYVLEVSRGGDNVNDFNFTDVSLAGRVRTAFVHAAKLCGGMRNGQ